MCIVNKVGSFACWISLFICKVLQLYLSSFLVHYFQFSGCTILGHAAPIFFFSPENNLHISVLESLCFRFFQTIAYADLTLHHALLQYPIGNRFFCCCCNVFSVVNIIHEKICIKRLNHHQNVEGYISNKSRTTIFASKEAVS